MAGMRHVIGLALVAVLGGCGSSPSGGDDAGRDAPSAEGAAGDAEVAADAGGDDAAADGPAGPEAGADGAHDAPVGDAGQTDGAQADGAQTDATDDAGYVPPEGEFTIDGCLGLGGIDERCAWRYRFHLLQCRAQSPCARLMIFFAGGDMDCSANAYQTILETMAGNGYVAVCAAITETATGSGLVPYNDEAPRVDLLIQTITADPSIQGVWTGERLLLAGVSHGATAPVIAMARTPLDDQAHWHGAARTGACFFDGIYDIGALDAFLATGNGGNRCNLILSHDRAVGRYYASDPLVHSCLNNKCYCDPDHSAEMDVDTITGVSPSSFAIADWKLVECGSGLDACLQDVVPAAPIQALCSALDLDAAHTCAWDPMPQSGHLTCAVDGIDRCRTWFDALP
jgi:hypothetical protein